MVFYSQNQLESVSCKGEIKPKVKYTKAGKPGLAALPCFVLASHMDTCECSVPYALMQSHPL